MCGIAGFVERRDGSIDNSFAQSALAAMAQAIAHRGPDDQGALIEGPAGFAHRRLSIIDPAPHGRQPMRRGPFIISYNGEIYNYRELRAELEAAGDAFRTGTDTEVLLAALARWGEGALERVNGMFAFALWNADARMLTLARDRIGKKPLYYLAGEKLFLFGSEIKAILAWPGVERTPDLEALHHYLSLQYVPAPLTAFAGIRALPPGSVLTLSPHRDPDIRRYWRPPAPAPERSRQKEYAQASEDRTFELLKAAVERRMVADVPVGAFLSGGVDSSAVVALMAAASGRPVKTFSIGFDEPDFDERNFARLVAAKIGADHEEDVVRPDFTDLLPKIVWHYDQPFADPSAIPTYCVARLAQRAVTVALTGDGGDEFFLGYPRYAACAALERYDRLPGPARAFARAAGGAIGDSLAQRRPFGGLKHRLSMVGGSRAERYAPSMFYFQEADKRRRYGPLLRPYLDRPTGDLLTPTLDGASDFVSGAAWTDTLSYLPDDLLVKVDVASMAFGLEARAPFLDVHLMEHAQSLPRSTRMAGGALKAHLKAALRRLLPDEILDRPKMGFGVPIERWLRAELKDFAADLLTGPSARTRDFFAPDCAAALLSEHTAGRRQHHASLWAMLMLELWLRERLAGVQRRDVAAAPSVRP